MNDLIHQLQRARIVPLLGFAFICWLAYDFHGMYVEGFAQWQEWQHAGAFAYMGALVAAIKVMYDHIAQPIERDHD